MDVDLPFFDDNDLGDDSFGAMYFRYSDIFDELLATGDGRSLDSYTEGERQKIREKCAKTGREDPWAYQARNANERRVRQTQQSSYAEKKEKRAENAELPPVKKASTEFKIALQQARMAAGLKQSEVATKLKVTAKIVSDWESGKSLPTGPQRSTLNKVLKTILPKS